MNIEGLFPVERSRRIDAIRNYASTKTRMIERDFPDNQMANIRFAVLSGSLMSILTVLCDKVGPEAEKVIVDTLISITEIDRNSPPLVKS